MIWSYYWRTVDETLKSHSEEKKKKKKTNKKTPTKKPHQTQNKTKQNPTKNLRTGRTYALGVEGLCHCRLIFA